MSDTSQTIHPPGPMTVDEFLVWAEAQDGRWELYGGVPYLMAPERTGHGKVKFAVQTALASAIRKAGLSCHMQPDGATVRTAKDRAHEPDALVYCGQELPPDAIEVPNPVIVVEVSSPSTRRIDASIKLIGYFSLPSVRHYLIVNPDGPPVIHHSRQADATILTRILAEGELQLDPPGLEVTVAELFASP
ncbi:MAG: Uma2 family endonuclease [Hyphomicrobiaceae bacterium]|nr:Uma2 family endonuclease [Hyphomicrobiaceae bacterium]